jgi:hypothetical protein
MVRKIEQYAELGNGKIKDNEGRISYENGHFNDCGNVGCSSDAAGKRRRANATKV